MIFIWNMRGATAHEWQIGRLWIRIHRKRYRPTSGLGVIEITDKDGSASINGFRWPSRAAMMRKWKRNHA